jgi:hypothetical protein
MIYPIKKQPYDGKFFQGYRPILPAKGPTQIREVIHEKQPVEGNGSGHSVNLLVFRLTDLFSNNRPDILAQSFFSTKTIPMPNSTIYLNLFTK